MSRRIRYFVACPTCGALPGEHCFATTTGRGTDTHKARVLADDEARRAAAAVPQEDT